MADWFDQADGKTRQPSGANDASKKGKSGKQDGKKRQPSGDNDASKKGKSGKQGASKKSGKGDGTVLTEGQLSIKTGTGMFPWSKRYAVLHATKISLFKNAGDRTPLQTVDVARISAVGCQKDIFIVTTADAKVLQFRAASENASMHWVHLIEKLLQADAVDADVVVLGGGTLGMAYAQWVKKWKPDARVVVLERRMSPQYKLGESTLAPTLHGLRSMGLTWDQMRVLFEIKNGLRFWWCDENCEVPVEEVDVVDTIETYQIERPVLEMALQRLTREAGVDLRVGSTVNLGASDLKGNVKVLQCEGPGGARYTLRCRILCDATGPSAVIQRHLGYYRKDMDIYKTFNTTAYYGYFIKKEGWPDLERFDHPATRHLCFPEGWVWIFDVRSLETETDDAKRAFVNDVLNHNSADGRDVPHLEEFAERNNVTVEIRTSIGIVVRDDMDTSRHLPAQERFQYWVDKYPALAYLLENYDVVDDAYTDTRGTYGEFRNMSHDSTQVAGDGYLAIGDAAQFTNPFWSPGLTGGNGASYKGAKATVEALNSQNYSRSSFKDYERYMKLCYLWFIREVDMHYRSFLARSTYRNGILAKMHFVLGLKLQVGKAFGHLYTEHDSFDVGDTYTAKIEAWVKAMEDMVNVKVIGDGPLSSGSTAEMESGSEESTEEDSTEGSGTGSSGSEDDSSDDGSSDGGSSDGGSSEDESVDAYNSDDEPEAIQHRAEILMDYIQDCAAQFPFPLGRISHSYAQGPVRQEEPKPPGAWASYECSCGNWGATTNSKCFRCGEANEDYVMGAELKVAKVTQECKDVKSFTLTLPKDKAELFKHEAGQYVTVVVEIDNEEFRRAYSLSSDPGDAKLRITVKKVSKGTVSAWLFKNLKKGGSIQVEYPTGRFVAPPGDGTVILFSAGVGVTPILPLAKAAIAQNRKVILVHTAKEESKSVFTDDLAKLKGASVHLHYTAQQGRMTPSDVTKYVNGITGHIFLCGPVEFMDMVEDTLDGMGVEPGHIHQEKFISPKPAGERPKPATSPDTIIVELDGEEEEIDYEKGQTLTEAFEEAGLNVPFSCQKGYCGQCIGEVVDGEVIMDIEDALSNTQKKRGCVLACQAFPASENLTVRFTSA